MRTALTALLILVIGICIGEYLFQLKHNPDKLEQAVLYDIGNVYMRGCVEAMNKLAKKKGYYEECRKLSQDTIRDHQDIFLNKIWGK